MKDYLKVYKAKIHVMSPTFVGSGKDISKKEYCLSARDQKVIVYDPAKMYQLMQKAGKSRQFEDYLLNDSRNELERWLQDNRVSVSDVAGAVRYSVSWGDRMELGKSRTTIMEFVKDPYGCPYVPGTSIKGMFRTILLGYEIMKNRSEYSQQAFQIKDFHTDRPSNKNYQKDSKHVEGAAFNRLNRDEKKRDNAVNDVLQGLIISDSKPLSLDDLVLCQKIEYHTNKEETALNILRECLRPGTDIEFTITIDTQSCPYSIDAIREAVKVFNEMYYSCFLSKFGSKQRPADTVYIGGGVGFVSKTFIYPMFGCDDGVRVAENIFRNTLHPRVFAEHGHKHDSQNGVSPHILKCTKLNGKRYQMGMCRLIIEA